MGLNKNKELLQGCEWLERFEGYESQIYLDTEDIETVGMGRNLEVWPFSPEELRDYELDLCWPKSLAYEWAYSRLHQCRYDITVHNPWLVEQPTVVRLIVTDMVYNLGLKGTLGFVKMLKALKKGEYNTAALELQDSKYFKQTGQRALHHYRLLCSLDA